MSHYNRQPLASYVCRNSRIETKCRMKQQTNNNNNTIELSFAKPHGPHNSLLRKLKKKKKHASKHTIYFTINLFFPKNNWQVFNFLIQTNIFCMQSCKLNLFLNSCCFCKYTHNNEETLSTLTVQLINFIPPTPLHNPKSFVILEIHLLVQSGWWDSLLLYHPYCLPTDPWRLNLDSSENIAESHCTDVHFTCSLSHARHFLFMAEVNNSFLHGLWDLRLKSQTCHCTDLSLIWTPVSQLNLLHNQRHKCFKILFWPGILTRLNPVPGFLQTSPVSCFVLRSRGTKDRSQPTLAAISRLQRPSLSKAKITFLF
jgi:hypothetical protein